MFLIEAQQKQNKYFEKMEEVQKVKKKNHYEIFYSTRMKCFSEFWRF